MKLSVKKLSLVFAMLLTVAIGPVAWSATLGVPYEVTGTVYECETGSSGMLIDTGSEIVSIYGKGPVGYWEDNGVAFPEVGDPITILVCDQNTNSVSIRHRRLNSRLSAVCGKSLPDLYQ